MPRRMPESLERIGIDLFNGLRLVGQRALANGVRSVAEDVRGVFDEAQGRISKFIEGAEEIARQGKRENDDEVNHLAEVMTSRQTPQAKRKGKKRGRKASNARRPFGRD